MRFHDFTDKTGILINITARLSLKQFLTHDFKIYQKVEKTFRTIFVWGISKLNKNGSVLDTNQIFSIKML